MVKVSVDERLGGLIDGFIVRRYIRSVRRCRQPRGMYKKSAIEMLALASTVGMNSRLGRALFKEPRVNVAQVQSGHRNAGRRGSGIRLITPRPGESQHHMRRPPGGTLLQGNKNKLMLFDILPN